MQRPHLLVHDPKDNVGVVVVEGLESGTEMLCVITADDTEFSATVVDDVPLGHKVALQDFDEGATVIKYGEDIGRVTKPIKKGCHVHTHNLVTKRW